jgi:hypothetical protein
MPGRGLERLVEAAPPLGVGHQPVDHDLDRVLLLLVERDLVLQLDEGPVDPGPDESQLPPLCDLLPVLPLPALDHRGEDLEPLPLARGEEVVDHLLDGLAPDRAAAVHAVLNADAGEEEP